MKNVFSNSQKKTISSLKIEGCYNLAKEYKFILANKDTKRKSKIAAIKYAANIRDRLELIAIKLLKKYAITIKTKDIIELLDTDLDRLEEKLNKILTEYLEYKSNSTKTVDERLEPEEENYEEPKVFKKDTKKDATDKVVEV